MKLNKGGRTSLPSIPLPTDEYYHDVSLHQDGAGVRGLATTRQSSGRYIVLAYFSRLRGNSRCIQVVVELAKDRRVGWW